MIASFIPYFIAANLAADTLTWSKGPEYVLTGNIELFIGTGYHDDDTNMTTTSEIRCQSKSSDTVKCVMVKTDEIVTSQGTRHDVVEDNDPIYFEAMFDVNGVTNLTVSASLRPIKRVLIKRLASLFSVGVDLTNPSVTSAEGTTERSVLGECENTLVKVESHDAVGNAEHLDGQTYDLYPIPLSQNGRRMNVVVDKIRDPSKCSAKDMYYSFIATPTAMEVKSSASKITISDNGSFTSSSVSRSKFEIPDSDDIKTVYIYEKLSMNLSDVKEAAEPIPSVPDPHIISADMLPDDVKGIYE